jgi:hypothetical protein
MVTRILWIAAFVTAVAFGQVPAAQTSERILQFAPSDNLQNMQEILNVIHAVAEINGTFDPALRVVIDNYTNVQKKTPQNFQDLVTGGYLLDVDADRMRTLTLSGPADRVAMAEWVFNEIYKPLGDPAVGVTNQYRFSNAGESVRVFRAVHVQNPRDLQEIINTIRALTEITQMMPYSSRRAIAVRGSIDRVELAQWLFQTLDRPAGGKADAILGEPPALGDEAVRVFFLAHTQSEQSLQQILNTVRAATRVTRIMPVNLTRAIALRGTEAQLALAEQTIKDLDHD